MLVGWCVDELDLDRKLSELLSVEELVECVFFGDVPLDGVCGSRIADGFKSPQCPVNESPFP